MKTDGITKIESFLTMKDGTELYYTTNIPQELKAIIVIVHGVCEHCGRYEYITGILNAAGYGVLRFDLRGHGKSKGERGYASTFLDYSNDVDSLVDKIRVDYPSLPIFLLGHSMGAFVSAIYALNYPGKLKGQVLSGLPAISLPLPTIKMLGFLPYNAFPMIRLGNDLGKVVSRDPEVVKSYIEDPLNLKKATIKMSGEMFIKGPEWLSKHVAEYNLPCLLLHGGNDLIVTEKSSEWFYNSISSTDKKRIVYPELYHEIFNEKEKDIVIADAIKWLDAHYS